MARDVTAPTGEIAALAAQPLAPDQQTAIQEALWAARAAAVPGLEIVVSPCPYSADELAAFAADGRRVGYLPPQVATQADRHWLGIIFPLLRSYAVGATNRFPNIGDAEGWFDYSTAVDAENLGTDEAQIGRLLEQSGDRLLTLNQYIVASQDSLALTGQYLDETRTWSRVGSTIDGKMIATRFDGPEMATGLGDEPPAEGALLVGYDVAPTDCGPTLGARTTSAPTPAVSCAEAQAARDRIAKRFVAAGFPAALGLTPKQYLESLPNVFAQPPAYQGRFDQLLLVETRLPWATQVDLLGMAMSFDGRDNPYWPIDERSTAPDGPYVGWFGRWGVRFPDPIAPDDARAQLRADEVGASPFDLIAMAVVDPNLLIDGRFFDAIGYLARPLVVPGYDLDPDVVRTPGMYHWRGKPEIGANMHPVAFAIFRPLVRGERIGRSRSGNVD